MSRLSHLLTLLLVVLVPAVLLGACGSDEDRSGESVDAVLERTFDGTGKAVKSGKLDLSLRLDLDGAGRTLDDPIAIALSGPFENQGDGRVPRFDFNLNLDGGGQQLQAGAVSTGEGAFLVFADQAYEVDQRTYQRFRDGYADAADKQGARREAAPTLSALGVDPRRWLKRPREVGIEQVGGVETIHLTAAVDVPKMLEDVNRLVLSANKLGLGKGRVPDALSPTELTRAAEALTSVKVDVWTGREDKALRRLTLSLNVDVPPNERRKAGLAGGTLDLEYAIGDLNRPQTIREPTNARPITELNQALAALAAGAGLGAGSGAKVDPDAGRDEGASTTTTPSPSQAYLDCLESAGEDATKTSECSRLLTQP